MQKSRARILYPASAAEQLQRALAQLDIAADVHVGDRIALVSVWTDLVVWTDGVTYLWWTGKISPRTRRYVYTGYPVTRLEAVARAVKQRYDTLRTYRRPWSADGAQCG
ncbi:hypothetical protein [Spongiactinospora sp. 9N601]|uniref:hypothetical protein n=1 Tax=Spongiactinospora sp. 9N601 TaxID=3375149 RepID=UPI003793BD20